MEIGEFIITCMLLISITFNQILNPVGKNRMKIKIKVQRTIGKMDTFFISIIIKCLVYQLASQTGNIKFRGPWFRDPEASSVAGPLMFSPSLTPLSPLHTHTRHLKQGFWSSPIEALQSNSSKKEGEGEKRRLLDFLQSESSPYLWLCVSFARNLIVFRSQLCPLSTCN